MVRTLSHGITDVSYNGPGGAKPSIGAGLAADEVEYEPYGRASRRVDLAADFDYSGVVDVADIFAFLSAWFANDPRSDANGDGVKTTADIFAFLSLWFSTASTASLGPADSVSDPSVGNPYGYCGYYFDAETYGLLGPRNGALYHVRHRVYDPAAGRWLTRDPAGFVDGMNLYGYVGGRAIAAYDPYGLDAYWAGSALRSIGLTGLGEYVDNFADGANVVADTVAVNPGATAKGAAKGAVVAGAVSAAAVVITEASGPAAPVVGTLFIAVFTIYAVYQVDQLGDNWNNMTAQQQAEAIGELGGSFLGGLVGGKAASRPSRPPTRIVTETGSGKPSTSGPEIKTIDPTAVRFSQDSVKSSFKDGRSIQELADGLQSGTIDPNIVEPIRIVAKHGKLYALDNRRLVAFKMAGKEMPYRMATVQEMTSESWKFTTTNDGANIRIWGEGGSRIPSSSSGGCN